MKPNKRGPNYFLWNQAIEMYDKWILERLEKILGIIVKHKEFLGEHNTIDAFTLNLIDQLDQLILEIKERE